MAPPSTRTVWKGAISFGLVHIPIALHSATAEVRPKFRLFDSESMAPVGYQQVSKTTGKAVDAEQMIKGLEVEEGQYVTLSKEEIREALPKATQTVDIEAFVNADEIDPAFYNKPYHVVPSTRGHKAFALLRDTLRKTNRVGIARVVISTKQHMAALRPVGNGLMLNLLRWSEEMREAPAGAETEVKASDKEIKMAEMLVNDMVTAWSPDLFHDEFKEQVQALVDAKIKAGKITQVQLPGQEVAPASADVIDLTDMLRRSLQSRHTPTKTPARRAANEDQRRAAAAAKSSGKAKATVTPIRRKTG
jgi:DNA end-binding protein Ku